MEKALGRELAGSCHRWTAGDLPHPAGHGAARVWKLSCRTWTLLLVLGRQSPLVHPGLHPKPWSGPHVEFGACTPATLQWMGQKRAERVSSSPQPRLSSLELQKLLSPTREARSPKSRWPHATLCRSREAPSQHLQGLVLLCPWCPVVGCCVHRLPQLSRGFSQWVYVQSSLSLSLEGHQSSWIRAI